MLVVHWPVRQAQLARETAEKKGGNVRVSCVHRTQKIMNMKMWELLPNASDGSRTMEQTTRNAPNTLNITETSSAMKPATQEINVAAHIIPRNNRSHLRCPLRSMLGSLNTRPVEISPRAVLWSFCGERVHAVVKPCASPNIWRIRSIFITVVQILMKKCS